MAVCTGPRLRDATATVWPASSRLRVIGRPIAPSPMNPTFIGPTPLGSFRAKCCWSGTLREKIAPARPSREPRVGGVECRHQDLARAGQRPQVVHRITRRGGDRVVTRCDALHVTVMHDRRLLMRVVVV